MEFEYEILADDYAAAAVLYRKQSGTRKQDLGWLLAGTFLLVTGVIERERGVSPILLGAIGVWWMWAGFARIFVGGSYRKQCRKHYETIGLAGQKYRAKVVKDGFEVLGENQSWRAVWPTVSSKGEDDRVFMFYSGGIIFIFAKRYLADAQKQELRALSGLTPG